MRRFCKTLTALAAIALGLAPAAGQGVRTVDPNDAMTRDVAAPPGYVAPASPIRAPLANASSAAPVVTAPNETAPSDQATPAIPESNTYDRDDILGAAERTFGKGAAGLAEIVERTLKDQGRPNAYIAGSEGAGAVVIGLRYGSGVMSHKVEGERKVHWTGPSVGFDFGGDANKVFMLVYNLYDSEDIFRRFPAAEGRLYFIGGFAATYLRRGNVVLIPIRLGVGYRAGVNVGYLKFSKKGKWLPF